MKTQKSHGTFHRPEPDVDFPALEDEVLQLWDEISAFEASISSRPEENEYTFYDGPPFASGSPHYGHILAGILKDIVPRYWTMRGHRIERQFGWDTHGLPVEIEVERSLGVHGPAQIEAFGVDRFNAACRELVEETATEWEIITRKIGRWVDMENDYKTMDLSFMESVWWVFSELWKRDLVYQDFKVVPYSWGATTVLSNWEASEEYRDVDDPSITVRARVSEGLGPVSEGDWLLLWTTTPWTLPGNLAIAVGEDISYVAVEDGAGRSWIAAERAAEYWDEPDITATAEGRDMIGSRYEPLFPYFSSLARQGAFRVITSADVVTSEGTGLVHIAPAHGEEDFEAAQANDLVAIVDPTDAEGRFISEATDVAGLNIKDADPVLIDLLAAGGHLVRSERIRHSYPFCPRTHTPLMYKPILTWFVDVVSLRSEMVRLNADIHWVPAYVGNRRFRNWLQTARPWAVSRNRYWGTTIPVWLCDSCDESVCVGSVKELEQLSGEHPDDLHKHVVDLITFACQKCEGVMRRTPEVLDTWFDAGSMPYAQIHYPFENADRFGRRFPADFIAEGLDQTRGWFYTLMILSTALFSEKAFQNCVVNGIILDEEDRKLSKRLKNYPDPRRILDTHGADALRIYLMGSPLLRAESLRFSEEGVRGVVRNVLLPLWNAYSFFATYAEADGVTAADLGKAPEPSERPELDRWILSVLQNLVSEVNELMEGYYLYAVVPPLVRFIDDLTNWYIRRSRRRFWRPRSGDDVDKLAAFATLYEVLDTFARVLAPVAPFISEYVYQNLVVKASDARDVRPSVHHCDFPDPHPGQIDIDLERTMSHVRKVVRLGHSLRKQAEIKVRQPLQTLTIATRDQSVTDAMENHLELVSDELNVKEIRTTADESAFVSFAAKANFKALGPRLGRDTKGVARAISDLDSDAIRSILDGGSIDLDDHVVTTDDIVVTRVAKAGLVVAAEGSVSVALDTSLTPELVAEGLAREFVNRVQQMRRDSSLDVTDRIALGWDTASDVLADAIEAHKEWISGEVLAHTFTRSKMDDRSFHVGGQAVGISISVV
ncbi:MAG: isoleucine--tRNA ligase [Acidimicrobiia bacterium]